MAKTLAERLCEQQEQNEKRQIADAEAKRKAFNQKRLEEEHQEKVRLQKLIQSILPTIEKALKLGADGKPHYSFAVIAEIPVYRTDPCLRPLVDALISAGVQPFFVTYDGVFEPCLDRSDCARVGSVHKIQQETSKEIKGWEIELQFATKSLIGWSPFRPDKLLVAARWR